MGLLGCSFEASDGHDVALFVTDGAVFWAGPWGEDIGSGDACSYDGGDDVEHSGDGFLREADDFSEGVRSYDWDGEARYGAFFPWGGGDASDCPAGRDDCVGSLRGAESDCVWGEVYEFDHFHFLRVVL